MSGNTEDVTYMPAEQFDELVSTLDEPDGAVGVEPQFAVICREAGTPFINIYSRHVTRLAAEVAKDRAAWKHNAQEITYRLAVVEL